MNDLDARLSLAVTQTWYSFGYPRWVLILLEWLVHGIPWLIGSSLAFIYVCRRSYSRDVQQRFAILVFGLFVF